MNQQHDYNSVKSKRRKISLKMGLLSMLVCLGAQIVQANETTTFLDDTLNISMQSTVTGTVTDEQH